MSERARGLLLLLGVLLAAAALYRVVGNSAGPIVIFVVIGVRDAWAAERRRKRNALTSLLAQLRVQGREAREAMVERIDPPALRAYVRDALERDGSDEREGDVERFPFSRAVRRRVSVLHGAATAAGVGALAWAAIAGTPSVGARLAGVVMGALSLGVAWLVARRQRRLATVLEVSPFRITELSPDDGGRRTLLFNGHLVLENQPRRRRVLLRPGGGTEFIALDYARLGFARLLELVVLHGGFPVEKETDAS